jgi:hypothetical protein
MSRESGGRSISLPALEGDISGCASLHGCEESQLSYVSQKKANIGHAADMEHPVHFSRKILHM